MSNNKRKSAERRDFLSAEGRRVLSFLDGRPLKNGDITKEANGRPFFPGREPDFSISHSGNMVAVSYIKAAENQGEKLRTGCDIELERPRANIKEIAEDFFSVPEKEYILQGGKRYGQTRFYEIWTLKECFLKLRGLSVFEMRNVPSFICGGGHFAFDTDVSSPLTFYVYELSGDEYGRYLLASAIEGNSTELRPEIRWFSHPASSSALPAPFLSVRSIAVIKAAPSPAETVRPKM